MKRVLILLLLATTAAADVDEAIRLLKSKDEDDIVRGARMVKSMGTGGRKATRIVAQQLAHDDSWVRGYVAQAAEALGPDVAPSIFKVMGKTKDVRARRKMAEVLAKVLKRNEKHDRGLLKQLGDPDDGVRASLAVAFKGRGAGSIQQLAPLLNNRDEDVQDGAARALAQMSGAAAEPLAQASRDPRSRVRAGAVRAIGYFGASAPTELKRRVPELGRDPEASVRHAVAFALGRVRADPERTVQVLLRLFGDPARAVRVEAEQSARRLGDTGPAAWVGLLGGESDAVIERVVASYGKKAVDALTEGTGAANARVRLSCVRVIGSLNTYIGLPKRVLTDRLEDDDVRVRRAAATAIDRRNGPQANSSRALLAAFEDKDVEVRARAVHAMRHEKWSEVGATIVQKAIGDKSVRVQLAGHAAAWWQGQSNDMIALATKHVTAKDDALRIAAHRALQVSGRAGAGSLPALVAAAETLADPSLVDALGGVTIAHADGLVGVSERFARAPRATRDAIDRALTWLERVQDKKDRSVGTRTGGWDPKLFVQHVPGASGPGMPLYGAGVTGLAISTFIAAGQAEHPAVREGLDSLIRNQRHWGCLSDTRSQHFAIAHAFAAIAMCEAWIELGDPRYRRAAESAVRAAEYCRNPYLGWRYEPRGGENDTNVTVAMLHLLALAERGGIEVEEDAFAGGLNWLEKMTDGTIGYNSPGGLNARPEGLQERFRAEDSAAMSAAGLWGFGLLARRGPTVANLKGPIKHCKSLPPRWSGSFIDMYYWYYGSLAMFAQGKSDWKKWSKPLEKALLKHQCAQPEAVMGSWDPVGPWGFDGGRIYSTCFNALALLTPYRYGPEFMKGKPPKAYADAVAALRTFAKSEDEDLAARAKLWLTRAGAR